MKQYLSGWNFMRVFRLVVGVLVLVQGIRMHDWSFILIGALFSLMPVFNIGCCGSGSCSISRTGNRTCATGDKLHDNRK